MRDSQPGELVSGFVVAVSDSEAFDIPGQLACYTRDACIEDAPISQAGQVGVAAVIGPQVTDPKPCRTDRADPGRDIRAESLPGARVLIAPDGRSPLLGLASGCVGARVSSVLEPFLKVDPHSVARLLPDELARLGLHREFVSPVPQGHE